MNDVTTPKLPPPPRTAQNRSALSSALAVTKLPSARTMSTSRKLSMVRPHLRVRWPTPPPSPSPPRPVVEMMPPGTARPNVCVAWSTSPSRLPPPATAVRFAGFTHTPRIPDRSITRPSSTLPSPPPLWPPPRIAMSRFCSRPKFTAAITSAASVHRAITAGRLSIIALYNARESSYSPSPGSTRPPRTSPRSVSIADWSSCALAMTSPFGPSCPACGCRRQFKTFPSASATVPTSAKNEGRARRGCQPWSKRGPPIEPGQREPPIVSA